MYICRSAPGLCIDPKAIFRLSLSLSETTFYPLPWYVNMYLLLTRAFFPLVVHILCFYAFNFHAFNFHTFNFNPFSTSFLIFLTLSHCFFLFSYFPPQMTPDNISPTRGKRIFQYPTTIMSVPIHILMVGQSVCWYRSWSWNHMVPLQTLMVEPSVYGPVSDPDRGIITKILMAGSSAYVRYIPWS